MKTPNWLNWFKETLNWRIQKLPLFSPKFPHTSPTHLQTFICQFERILPKVFFLYFLFIYLLIFMYKEYRFYFKYLKLTFMKKLNINECMKINFILSALKWFILQIYIRLNESLGIQVFIKVSLSFSLRENFVFFFIFYLYMYMIWLTMKSFLVFCCITICP